jgi:hypothetical protein
LPLNESVDGLLELARLCLRCREGNLRVTFPLQLERPAIISNCSIRAVFAIARGFRLNVGILILDN